MNAFAIKMIALITMIIDHVGYMGNLTWYDKPYFTTFRIIGRISFPLFIFLIAEGCRYSKDLKKYMKRLLIFALITEIPFFLFTNGFVLSTFSINSHFDYDSRNVLFTLFLGVLTVYLYEKIKLTNFSFLSWTGILLTAPLAQILNSDYAAKGVITIFLMYLAKTKPMQILVIVFFAFSQMIYSLNSLQHFNYIFILNFWFFIFTILPSIIILLYNNKRGPAFQYLFYWAYPVHLAIIGLIWYIFFL